MQTRNEGSGALTYAYSYVNPNNPSDKKPHAVTQIGSAYYCYDQNGNMTKRGAADALCASGGDALSYDAENRLTSITVGGNTTTYAYDGDGARVKRVANGATTYYIGNHYEVTVSGATNVLKYYYFGAQRVAMRNSLGVVYLHSDHLGSTSATSGASVSSQTYYPYGSIRTTTGSVPTDFGFTGQRKDASSGLMYYGARYYDAGLGRFVSADTIVPSAGNPQSLNRYSYVLNNPLNYSDPSGHDPWWQEYNPRVSSPTLIPPSSTLTVNPEASRTASRAPSTPSSTPNRPTYTSQDLDIAARIVTVEVGTGIYVRPPTEQQLRDSSTALAWTMRNRIEVGDPKFGPKSNQYNDKAENYTETFYAYSPYSLDPKGLSYLPAEPDPTVYEQVYSVFSAQGRSGDPLQGAIYVVNLHRYDQLVAAGMTQIPVRSFRWFPIVNGKQQAEQGIFFFSYLPGFNTPTPLPTNTELP